MKNEIFTPINILWIEDNPLWHRGRCSEVKNKKGESVFDSSLDEEFLPVISLTGEFVGLENFFNLKVLQHPEEIKEYFSLCLKIEDKYGFGTLGNIEGVVPEVVVFDYKLFENIKINKAGEENFPISYSRPNQPIREFINPNFAILDKFPDDLSEFDLHLENPKNSGYDEDEFIKRTYSPDNLNVEEIEEIKRRIKNDEFGLYAGIQIVKLFRHHACVGIPATVNREIRKSLHPFSRFYEWLNQNDLSTALYREDRGDKTWNSILTDGMKQLRERIIVLVQSGKITPFYEQLNQLSDGNVPTERVFSLFSAYGERHLPLDGLFIDKTETIEDWALKLIGVLPRNRDVINEAIKVGKKLWDVYVKQFGKRFDLSDYSFREKELKPNEEKRFKELKKELCNKKGIIENECSIMTELPDAEYLDPTVRLTPLYLVTKGAIEMNKCKKNAPEREIYSDLNEYEYFNILFPKTMYGTPPNLLLPMHTEGKTQKSYLINNKGKTFFGKLLDKGSTGKGWIDFKEWSYKGERQLIRMIFVEDREYFPEWLK